MNDDATLRQLWQAQPCEELPTPDLPKLLELARAEDAKLRRTLWWRDVREIAVAVVLIPVWLWLGVHQHAPWPWYLMVPVLLFIAGFIAMGRYLHRNDRPHPGDPIVDALGKSLREINRQIWLLRQVHWWYLAPIFAVLLTVDLDSFFRGRDSARALITGTVFNLVLFAFIWWLNQRAVKKTLQPRLVELAQLLRTCSG